MLEQAFAFSHDGPRIGLAFSWRLRYLCVGSSTWGAPHGQPPRYDGLNFIADQVRAVTRMHLPSQLSQMYC